MKKLLILSAIFTIALTTTFTSCTKDPIEVTCDGSNPVYNNEVKNFISNSCSGVTCHSSGATGPDISSYSKLQPYLNSGAFEREVVTEQTMPKVGSLSPSELSWIKCWVENGYPEN